MSRSNDGAPLPVNPEERWYKVISPKGATRLRVTFLGDTFYGRWIHYDRRSIPCEETEECRHCKRQLPNRWTGFIAAWNHNQRERCIVILTEGVARQLLPLLDQIGTLRGCQVELYRRTPSKENSPVDVRFVEAENPHEIMDEHPIFDSLNRLWSLNESFLATNRPAAHASRPGDRAGGVPLPPQRPAAPEAPRPVLPRHQVTSYLDSIGRMPE